MLSAYQIEFSGFLRFALSSSSVGTAHPETEGEREQCPRGHFSRLPVWLSLAYAQSHRGSYRQQSLPHPRPSPLAHPHRLGCSHPER